MKIVIGLASVVILILVVVLLALRYLKADDDDDFEDMPDERREPRSNSGDRDRPAAGRQAPRAGRPAGTARNAEPRRTGDRHGQRPARDYDRAAAPGPRELAGAHGSQRPADTYDDRHGGGIPKGHQDSLPEVRPRPVRGKRSEQDGNWPSTKWDQLSDVDYWAQVASDKPLTTTAQPAAQSAQSAPARPGPPRDPGTRHGQNQGSRTATAPERSAAARPGSRLPVRGARQPAPAGLAASAPRPGGFSPAPHAAVVAPPQSAPPAVPGVNLRSAARPGRDAAPPGAYTPAPVYDDDPLTSPSFPKIPASDSRSYGAVRPETPPSGSRILPPQAADATQHLPSYGSPSGQFDGYDSAGRQHAEPASGFGPPGSLPADPGGLPPYRPAPADPGRHGGRAAPPAPLSPPPSLPPAQAATRPGTCRRPGRPGLLQRPCRARRRATPTAATSVLLRPATSPAPRRRCRTAGSRPATAVQAPPIRSRSGAVLTRRLPRTWIPRVRFRPRKPLAAPA